ncbi:Ig-like domain-containing protein [Lampropedia hyalina]|uniref:Ig-like domain-containing protein n=1 Tax=Lampropedia hyalina TaxID=198706 RepID=UPI00135634C6|nr:Ig-like domain-containing protein [Lampropedia hyalina]
MTPENLAVSADGTQLTGQGEPGASVTVKDEAGNTLGTGVVGDNGNFTVPLAPAQKNGETLDVTQKDAAGNASPVAQVDAGDTTAPAVPKGLAVSPNGTQLTGQGEPGASVTVKDDAGNTLGTGVVGDNGNFTVPLAPAQKNGETLDVTQKDAAGNTSPVAQVDAGDTTAPVVPKGLAVSPNGTQLTGQGEPGASVTVKDDAGNTLGTGVVGDNGNFTVPLAPAQKNGETLDVTQKDAAGNTSPVAQVDAGDSTAPAAPKNLAVSPNGTQLTGQGEPGASVAVKDAAGNTLGTGVVDDAGNFKANLSPVQKNGEKLNVTQKDVAGNTSPVAQVDAGDSTAPLAPRNLAVSPDGTQLTGQGEPGAGVTVKDDAGNTLGTGTVGGNGNFTINLSPVQKNGETLDVTQKDAAGNTSPVAQVDAGDSTAPAALKNLKVSEDGSQLTGEGEPGANVTITDDAGKTLGTGVVDDEGNFKANLSPVQRNGETLNVTQKDAAGNTSPVVQVEAGDSTAPVAPRNLAVSEDGSQLTGEGEPGADVTVKDDAGNTLGTGTVNDDGSFQVPLEPAQINGETLSVTQQDAADNTSPVVTVDAPLGIGSNSDFVEYLYQSILVRASEPDGHAYWTGTLDSGELTRAELVDTFLNSVEAKEVVEPVARLYYALLDREPEDAGLRYWAAEIRAGNLTLEEVSHHFVYSAEYDGTFGIDVSDEQFLNWVYQAAFARGPGEDDGRSSWLEALENGASRAEVLLGISESVEHVALTAEAIEILLLSGVPGFNGGSAALGNPLLLAPASNDLLDGLFLDDAHEGVYGDVPLEDGDVLDASETEIVGVDAQDADGLIA